MVDDHAIVRRGLRSLIESQSGLEVCAEAANGVEAMQHVTKDRPDLVVLDLTMPEKNGLELMRLIREESPSTDVLIFTMHFSEEVAREIRQMQYTSRKPSLDSVNVASVSQARRSEQTAVAFLDRLPRGAAGRSHSG